MNPYTREGRRLARQFDDALCRDSGRVSPADDARPLWDGDQFVGGRTKKPVRIITENTMPITYNPKDASDKLWPAGDYDAEILKVEDKVSKSSGNEMQAVTFKAYNDDGKTQLLTEYITANAVFKLKQLAVALDHRSDFEAGTFQADDHVGASLRLQLEVEENAQYGDRNRVKKMLPAAKAPAAPAPAPQRRPVAAATGGKAPTPKFPRPATVRADNPVSPDEQIDPDDIPF